MDNNRTKEKQFNDFWINDLPAKFPKKKAIKILSERFGVNERSTYRRLIDCNDLLARDISFLYEHFGICFSIGKGFYLDNRKFEEIQASEEREEAAALGLIL